MPTPRFISNQHSHHVMAIINLTPDSFYQSCDKNISKVMRTAEKALKDGANILDVGAYSSRPNAAEVDMEEEWKRLQKTLNSLRKNFPEAILSVDTFRAEIAKRAVQEANVQIINDISAGEADNEMFQTIANLQVAYIMMHMRGTPQTMQKLTAYENMMQQIIDYFQRKINTLHQLGVTDIVLDPGFGFAKTIEQNFELLRKMHYLQRFEMPLLVGVSRKSMIYKPLNTKPEEAMNGTTALHTLALAQGANILRVHDVKEAVETIQLYELFNPQNT